LHRSSDFIRSIKIERESARRAAMACNGIRESEDILAAAYCDMCANKLTL